MGARSYPFKPSVESVARADGSPAPAAVDAAEARALAEAKAVARATTRGRKGARHPCRGGTDGSACKPTSCERASQHAACIDDRS